MSSTTPPTPNDLRKVRFATIEGVMREDLPLANEIWLQDLYRAPWATREMMKLAALLVRYMNDSKAAGLSMGEVEIATQMSLDDIRKTFSAMRGFGAIDSVVAEKTQIQVALNLTLLQRLQVLETKRRFATALPGAQRIWTEPGEKWVAQRAA